MTDNLHHDYRAQLPDDLRAFIHAMPKAEIHVHLEGAIRPRTLFALAERHAALDELPAQDLAGLRRWFRFTDFPHFIQVYLTISALLRTPEDFAFIVRERGRTMAEQNIRYSELTVTPFTHVHLQEKNLTIDALLDGLEEGRRQARAEFGVEMRWVFDIPRNVNFDAAGAYDPWPSEQTLAFALRGLELGAGVVGFGLGGYEVDAPARPFAHAFAQAKAAGLLSVPHAGETMGAESVRSAVEDLHADRIGHGVRAMEDPAVLDLLLARNIPLEINPTSNICLHVYRRAAEHPFPHLDRMGLTVTVNSDDPPLFTTTLEEEYALLAVEFGYTKVDLARIARNAFFVCGLPPAEKARQLAEFDQWMKIALAWA
ncbi:MAG: adenosine deaminase [Caldilineaceae bacterium]|nr:adenosine deaminase [Caldilineaceae bacterium]MCB9137361.1 adenosine deaminase [Caldilineaceae bacterium]